MRLLRSHPELLGLAAAIFLMGLAHEALPNTFVLYADQRYGWSETHVGLVLALVGVGSLIVSMLVVKPAVRTLGERGAALTGLACGIAGFLIFGLAPIGGLFLIGLGFVALLGHRQSVVPVDDEPSHRPASEQGQLQGALGSMRAVNGMIGPLLFTQVFALAVHHGGESLLGAPFLLPQYC